ncbi:MAG TPA: type II toxin-antitoxin system prevent-host-death family antitoxin [Trueperaceae bacterium]
MEVTYSEARRSLAELLERAARGERITITRRGRPAAELGPSRSHPTLDLEKLARMRAQVNEQPLENGVLLAREDERF